MIKLIHVAKFVIWNTIASILLLSYAELSVVKFYLTFVLMGLIVLSLLVKIIIGTIYLFKHKLSKCCSESDENRTPGRTSMVQVV